MSSFSASFYTKSVTCSPRPPHSDTLLHQSKSQRFPCCWLFLGLCHDYWLYQMTQTILPCCLPDLLLDLFLSF